jgi:peptidoglycan/LPS O-acetylase OafA/YrhL
MSDLPIRRNQGLDLLRGIAILLVLFNHVNPHTIPQLPELNGAAGALYWRVKNLGWTGVDLFFVLSGFLISGLLFKEIETTGSLNAGRFWYRRAFKILPSYLFFLIVMAATKATAWLDTTSWATIGASLAKHLLFAQNYLGHNPNGPTWSLAVEEHFYILLPCLLLLLLYKASTREQFERWLLIVGSCVIAGVPVLRTVHAVVRGVSLDDYQLSHFRADGLFFGVMVQLLLRRQNPRVMSVCRHPGRSLLVAGILIAPGMFLGRVSPIMFSIGYTLLACGYALILLVFVGGLPNPGTSWAGKAVATTGRWSYNIYLWNFYLLLLPIPGYGALHQWVAANVHGAVPAFAAHTVVFFVTSILVGGLITLLIETPFLKLRDYCSRPAR